MQNLQSVGGEIKACAEQCTGSPTEKLIAVLIAAGITDNAILAAVAGIKIRAVQAARKRTTLRATECAAPGCAHQDAQTHDVAPKSAPGCVEAHQDAPAEPRVPARIESPSGIDSKPKVRKYTPQSPQPILEAFEAYNQTALRCGLPQAMSCTPSRRKKIGARLREVGIEGWMRALANIERSSFLTGGGKRGWCCTLDWLIGPENFGKVHDGGYGNGRHAAASKPKQATCEDVWRREAEAEAENQAWARRLFEEEEALRRLQGGTVQ